jgi:prepilin-type N-terminal cleavage/methylation domain-containing protein
MKIKNSKKGFTLIELLVVIAIIAILAVVVVLTLNPAQLLAQARDSNRVSDFATLKSGIALYQADVSSTSMGTSSVIDVAYGGTNLVTSTLTSTSSNGWGYNSADATSVATNTSVSVNGSGWLPIDFNAISSGAPFGSEPIDPLGTGTNSSCYNGAGASSSPCMYSYVYYNGQYKLAAKMESTKYAVGGSGDVESGDGGNSSTTYEQGTDVNL